MFDIGWSEILVIVVVAIVVVGPKDLPPMLRAAGRMVAKMRRQAGEFQQQFNEALKEAELDGVKESIDELRGLNPLKDIKKQLDPIQAALSSPTPIAKAAPEPVPPPPGQPPQPTSDADIEPAALVASEPAAVAEAVPKRTRKSKPKAELVDGEIAVTPAPRARKVKAVAEAQVEAAPEAPAKKPRAPRRKSEPAAVADKTASAPETPSVTESATSPEGSSA